MRIYYLPTNWKAFIVWGKNFLAEIVGAAKLLNEPDADVAAIQADVQELLDAVDAAEIAAENARKANAVKTAVAKKVNRRIRSFVTRLKANPLYTEEIGGLLRIVSAWRTADSSLLKPILNIKISGGLVQLGLSKQGMAGANVYSILPGENNFSLLGPMLKKSFTDPRPPKQQGIAELRQYRAMFLDKNGETGQWSEIVSISYSG